MAKIEQQAALPAAIRVEQLADLLPHLVWLCAPDRSLIYANARWERYTGLSIAEQRGRDWLTLLHGDDRAPTQAFVENAALSAGIIEVEFRVRRHDGDYRWFLGRVVPVRTESGALAGWLATASNIERRKQIEAALSEATFKLQQLERANVIGIIEATLDRITHANDLFLDMIGYSREDLDRGAISWRAITPPEYAADDDAGVAELIEHGVCTPFEKEYIRKDGTRVPILLGAALLHREPLAWICFVLDISERKRVEHEREALLASEQAARAEAQAALRTRDEFLSTVTHDLRSPLTTIHGLAQFARRQLSRLSDPAAASLIEQVERIDAKATQMTGMIEELLDLSRQSSGGTLDLEREPVELVALARRAAAELAREQPDRTITVEAEADLLGGYWDRARIERVVSNLLSNAVKYSPPGSPITLTLAREEDGGRAVAALSVRDRGFGIPAADQPHIFERFFRGTNVVGRVSGTGIGLFGAKQIVEQHGGTIAVDSVEGAGTTVTFRLPLDEGSEL